MKKPPPHIQLLFRRALCPAWHTFLYRLLLLVVLPLYAGAPGPTQVEIAVAENIQVPLLFNVLTFDRNLKSRVGHTIVLGIIYQEKYRQSLDSKNQVELHLKKSNTNQIDGIPLQIIPIPFLEISQLKSTLETEKINLVYITPLRAVSVAEIAQLCKTLKLTSLTGVPEYCQIGITVGIGSKGGNPLIIINLATANAAGNDFSSRLLKLAKVIDLSGAGE